MQLSRVLRIAACLAGLTAISAVGFAVPTLPAQPPLRVGSECQADKPEPKSLAFVVRYVERRPAGEFILTFENGEIWQQDDRNKKVIIERGEQVVIRRSTTGVFTLVSRDGQTTRVKRMH
ncbi:MAG TPA: hypothetical protein VEW08_08240 [Steroidobacteraceae bacterium]|nr:hypothetical protein [Steroidobacteraceae bacterium]